MSDIQVSEKDIRTLCSGRKCSKKKDCLLYDLYMNGTKYRRFIPVAPNHCGFDGKYSNFIPIGKNNEQ
jgi:hypothetical protein